MRYGFVIDNRKCIGCHACTVACKTEHSVPVGVNRTWVKAVEKGQYPDTRRVFQVTRCNHCEEAPCVTICPVKAMFHRKDGIVDFSSDRCIGCKACMQACPYDAIHIDPGEGTAAKCNFCAHRTEIGLEPACVTVCPEHAIIAGDLDEPGSEIATLLARQTVRVRKPEQGTKPKLFYIDADEAAIVPTAARHEAFYMAAERNGAFHGGGALYPADSPLLQRHALAAYDVGHARPWGWQVPAYCFTKAIGAGALAVPALAVTFGSLAGDRTRDLALSTVALVFTAITAVLLMLDLDRKERFLRVILMAQKKSWLARGAFILLGYSALCGMFWLATLLGLGSVASVLLWPTIAAGMATAGYTAFLFGQCEGRDLWQTPLLPVHLVVQALMCGAAVLGFLPAAFGGDAPGVVTLAGHALAVTLALHLLILLGEVGVPHTTDNARYAARLMTRGPFRRIFWGGAVIAGGVVPLALVVAGASSAPVVAAAGALAVAGLLAFEWCFVMAGQSVPNS